jgi:aspartate/methionine/tyrosine aminotransferase
MNSTTRTMASTYLEWAKLHSEAKYNLATSGILAYPFAELPDATKKLEINGPTAYGYQPLQARLACKCGVSENCVVAVQGTAMANHLAMAAILSPGDQVLIERPAYGPIFEVASYLGAKIRRFDRRSENDFQIDPDEIKRSITPRTRLVVITNLHNPSGAFTDEQTLAAIGEIAMKVGARVLLDEVYLDMIHDRPVRSSFHLGEPFIATNSLTKAYGLSGLRCGWILADEKLAERIWRLNDLFGATPVHPAELLSVVALDHLELIGKRARRLLETNRQKLNAFFASTGDLEVVLPRWGTVSFPKLKHGSAEEFCGVLRTLYDTSVVPGRFFEMPQHFRIGIGGDTDRTTVGLEKLALALSARSAKQATLPGRP